MLVTAGDLNRIHLFLVATEEHSLFITSLKKELGDMTTLMAKDSEVTALRNLDAGDFALDDLTYVNV